MIAFIYIVSLLVCITPFLYYRIYRKDKPFYIFGNNRSNLFYFDSNESKTTTNILVFISLLPLLNSIMATLIIMYIVILYINKILEFLVDINMD